MECACMDLDCDEKAERFTSCMPKARKPYKCCECRREIAIGEKYSLENGEISSDWIIQLTPTAADKIFGMIEKCWKRISDSGGNNDA